MKHLVTLLVSFALLVLPAVAVQRQPASPSEYIAVIASHDLSVHWSDEFPQFKRDYYIEPNDFNELGPVLDDIVKQAAGKPIYLDFEVHGDDSGLQIRWDDHHGISDANMGYIVHQIEKHCAGKLSLVTFESCYAGRAYKNTIRGVKPDGKERIYNYPTVPSFAIYGTGDNHGVIGQPMYLQHMHGERNWWVDLRDYDQLGKNKPLHAKEKDSRVSIWGTAMSETTYAIYQYVESYRYPKEN